jgi:hypothetical protein
LPVSQPAGPSSRKSWAHPVRLCHRPSPRAMSSRHEEQSSGQGRADSSVARPSGYRFRSHTLTACAPAKSRSSVRSGPGTWPPAGSRSGPRNRNALRRVPESGWQGLKFVACVGRRCYLGRSPERRQPQPRAIPPRNTISMPQNWQTRIPDIACLPTRSSACMHHVQPERVGRCDIDAAVDHDLG